MLLLALLLAAGPIPRGAPGRSVAVLEFDSQLAAGGPDRLYYSDLVRGEIKRLLPEARMMTRENVVQLLTAVGKKLEDCVGECEVETGRMLGADLVVSGRLTKVGTRFKLSLRLHATADGTLISTATASGETEEKLDDAVADSVGDLLAAIAVAPPPRTAGSAQPGPKPALLIVESVPPGARVIIDGHERGTAPLSISGLAPGRHALRLELDDYQPLEQEVSVQAAKDGKERLTLQRLRGQLTVQSAQAARCTVGGQERAIAEGGMEPFDLPVGEQEVRCSASGYEAFSESVTIKAGKIASVRVKLERERVVTSTPHNYGPLLRSLAGIALLGGGAVAATRLGAVRNAMQLRDGSENLGPPMLGTAVALGLAPAALATAVWSDGDELGVPFALSAGAIGGVTAATVIGLWFAGQDGAKVPGRGSFSSADTAIVIGGVALGATGASLLVQGLRNGFDLGPERTSTPRAHAALYGVTGAALIGLGGMMVAQRVAVARGNFTPDLATPEYPAGSTIGLSALGALVGGAVTYGWASRAEGVPWLATIGGTAAGGAAAMLFADNWTFGLGMGLVGSGLGLLGAAAVRSQSTELAAEGMRWEPSAIALRTRGGTAYGPGLMGQF